MLRMSNFETYLPKSINFVVKKKNKKEFHELIQVVDFDLII